MSDLLEESSKYTQFFSRQSHWWVQLTLKQAYIILHCSGQNNYRIIGSEPRNNRIILNDINTRKADIMSLFKWLMSSWSTLTGCQPCPSTGNDRELVRITELPQVTDRITNSTQVQTLCWFRSRSRHKSTAIGLPGLVPQSKQHWIVRIPRSHHSTF